MGLEVGHDSDHIKFLENYIQESDPDGNRTHIKRLGNAYRAAFRSIR